MLAAPLADENTTILLSLAFGPYREVAMRFFFDAFMREPASLVSVVPCFKDYIGSVCQPLNQRSSLNVFGHRFGDFARTNRTSRPARPYLSLIHI